MNRFIYLIMMLVGPAGLIAEVTSDIAAPVKRVVTIDLARTLLSIKSGGQSEEELATLNPFSLGQVTTSEDEGKSTAASQPGPVNSGDLLKNIAEKVLPTGMIHLAGKSFLLVGQKKFQLGDRMSVTYQDVIYEVEITAIERTSFTIRFKNDEITRPIKASVKKP
jgi:hypothetical protein